MIQKRSPVATGIAKPGGHCKSHQHGSQRPPRKQTRILTALLRGERLHRRIAERQYGDHALPSTVATLGSLGVRIERRIEEMPGYAGESAYMAVYWIDATNAENLARARELIARDGGAVRHRDVVREEVLNIS